MEYLHDDYGFTLQESLSRIYHSKLYKKLATESTKYWHLGPVDLYNELKEEGTGVSVDWNRSNTYVVLISFYFFIYFTVTLL